MKLFVHAGFAKAASSSVQSALDTYNQQLADESIYKFGTDLKVGAAGIPQDYIQTAANADSPVTGDVLSQLALLRGAAVLSTENLQSDHMPRVLANIDEFVDVHIVFYMRPQHSWIPSAWRQWYMKNGCGLREYIDKVIEEREPNFLVMARAWRDAFPASTVTVRPLHPEFLVDGEVANDFFHLIGSSLRPGRVMSNPSPDYSLQHLMYLNAQQLFADHNDARIEQWLLERLPEQYRRPNIEMIDYITAANIHEAFRDDNIALLSEFFDGEDAQKIIDFVLAPTPTYELSYLELPSDEIVERGRQILAETIGLAEAKERRLI